MQVLLVYLDLHYVFKLINVSIVELHVLAQDEICILMKSVLWSNKWFKYDFILFYFIFFVINVRPMGHIALCSIYN